MKSKKLFYLLVAAALAYVAYRWYKRQVDIAYGQGFADTYDLYNASYSN